MHNKNEFQPGRITEMRASTDHITLMRTAFTALSQPHNRYAYANHLLPCSI